jgi:alpha-L-rhamnosidase
MNQLAVNGHGALAYRLLESHRFPSWLYSVDQGATTIWERWDGYVKGRGFQDLDMNSFNHYALGAVGEWMAEHILGITPDEKAPGYRHFFIDPIPGGSLKQASGTYHSVAGEIGVTWEQRQGGFTYTIEVPVNTSATVTLPTEGKITEDGRAATRVPGVRLLGRGGGKTSLLVQSGNYVFQF